MDNKEEHSWEDTWRNVQADLSNVSAYMMLKCPGCGKIYTIEIHSKEAEHET